MKRMLCVCALVLALCLAVPAMAEDYTYETTALFVEALDAEDMVYTYEGMDSNDYERLEMPYGADNLDMDVKLFFHENEERCGLRVWDVIEYDEAMKPVILNLVNELNGEYILAKWTADDDNTVTVAMDVILRPDDSMGDILLEAVARMVDIVDAGYPTLAPYAK